MSNPENDIISMTMKTHKICVVVPTYNNAGTLSRVIDSILDYCSDVIVVNDGSTDETAKILDSIKPITVVSYPSNKGKGAALREGFRKAITMGFDYAITIDSDGQHYAKDIPSFVKAIVENPNSLIIGARDLSNVEINGKSSFANKFSNFWFTVQTGKKLQDTQTGYRAYPLKNLYGLNLLTSRYEAELELLVFAAWNGVRIVSIPIHVYYPPKSERVSHFRPGPDFTRISVLNTILCFGAILYGIPMRVWKGLTQKQLFNFEFKQFTRKKGIRKEAATTLSRLFRSWYAVSHLVFWSMFVFTPFAFIYLGIGPATDKKKLKFHKMLKRISSFFAHNFPGSGTLYENPSNEDFSKPAMVVCNHQSHLDLPVLMAVNHKFIFLTKDWVWNNFFFGKIVRWAEYLPVSSGLDTILPRLRELVNKGYSIVVFPEGTRSEDCKIKRFHQGAFYLANELNLDIVPMVLHGAGEYLPKNDFMLRKGKITLKILPRITSEHFSGLLLRKQASLTRKLIDEEFQLLKNKIESPEYFKSIILYKYAYRGWNIASSCKMIISKLDSYRDLIYPLDQDEIWFINAGIGVIPLLTALSNRDKKVNAIIENQLEFEIATNTPCLPENLHYHHAIWADDYNVIPDGAKVFVIGNHVLANQFQKFNPTMIIV